jgi:hypothetical protein
MTVSLELNHFLLLYELVDIASIAIFMNGARHTADLLTPFDDFAVSHSFDSSATALPALNSADLSATMN